VTVDQGGESDPESFMMAADMTRRDSGIYLLSEHREEWQPLPFTTADASSDTWSAARIAADYHDWGSGDAVVSVDELEEEIVR